MSMKDEQDDALSPAQIKGRQMRRTINTILGGGVTRRFHTVDTVKEDNVAQHSFGVAWFCYILSPEQCTANLLLAALAHDLPEHEIGDVPSPTKRADPALWKGLHRMEREVLKLADLEFEITEEQERILKLADCLDGLRHCVAEKERGNNSKSILTAFSNYRSYCGNLVETPHEQLIFSIVLQGVG